MVGNFEYGGMAGTRGFNHETFQLEFDELSVFFASSFAGHTHRPDDLAEELPEESDESGVRGG